MDGQGGRLGSARQMNLHLEVIVVLAIRHLDERVGEVGLPGLLLQEPDFVEALPADATTQVGVKLGA